MTPGMFSRALNQSSFPSWWNDPSENRFAPPVQFSLEAVTPVQDSPQTLSEFAFKLPLQFRYLARDSEGNWSAYVDNPVLNLVDGQWDPKKGGTPGRRIGVKGEALGWDTSAYKFR